MNADTAEGWRNIYYYVKGLYDDHGGNLSVRMIRRRIQGLSEADAQLILAIVAIANRKDDVLEDYGSDNELLPPQDRRRLA
jgi:hypothetical protein